MKPVARIANILIYRREEEISLDLSFLSWLQFQPYPKILWPSRAAAGLVTAFTEIPQIESLTDSSLRLYGWQHFEGDNQTKVGNEWRLFPKKYYYLPEYELFNRNNKTIFAINSLTSDFRLPTPNFSRFQLPSAEIWADWLLSRPVEKVVLARRVSISSALLIAEQLQPTFFIQMAPESAFFGKPPEYLYKRHGRHLESEAVAGTQLLGEPHTAKDHRELDYIESALRAALTPLSTSELLFSSLTTRIAGTLHHLCRTCSCELREEVTDTDLLKALHPTPAVGGWPREEALAYLSNCEPFKRGLYAAPVGWISSESAEWLVAIRSALLDGDTLHLYSGAGIVNESQADQEWQELNRKLKWATTNLTPAGSSIS